MHVINRPLQAIARRWWAILLVLLLNGVSFTILFALEDRFEALAGVPTFDTQNDLTAETLRAQLPLYTGAAREAYYAFAAFDFVFPFIAALFLAVLFTALLRANRSPVAGRLLASGAALLPFLGTLFDYGENVGFLSILAVGADSTWVSVALLFKQLKLLMLQLNGPILLMLVLWLLIGWLRTRRTRANRAAHTT
jgi:hypothetical protein